MATVDGPTQEEVQVDVGGEVEAADEPGATLLAYSLISRPDPLSVGADAELILTVSNPQDDAVTCTGIVFTLPVGTAATDLIDGKAALAVRPAPGWTSSTNGGAITLTPPGGSAKITGEGLPFAVALRTNDQPGTASIEIDETASTDDDPTGLRSSTIDVGKFPADFSLSSLTSVPPERLHIPYGKTATLMWTATGEGVSCTLEYQPTDDPDWVTRNVANQGPVTSLPLTRSDNVVFTLTAQVAVLGQDQPLVAQSQLQLAIDTLSLTFEVQPPSVAPNGLVRLRWHAPNADHCTLDDGTVLPPSGAMLVVLQQSRLFVLTAHGAGGVPPQLEREVVVDPSIIANQPPIEITGEAGAQGPNGNSCDGDNITNPRCRPSAGGQGGRGGDAVLSRLPPLDETRTPRRVIPIRLTGGTGGPGGFGGGTFGIGGDPFDQQPDGPGGPGGDAVLDVTFDGSGDPAQYIVTLVPGAGGPGSSPGPSGSVRLNVREEALQDD